MPRRRDAGIGYLDMMVGLALLGIMTLFLSGSFAFGRRVWERADRFDACLQEQLLRAWMAAASSRGAALGTPAAFEATASGFRYRGVVRRAGFPLHDLAEIAVTAERAGLNVTIRVDSPLDAPPIRRSGTFSGSGTEIAYLDAATATPTWRPACPAPSASRRPQPRPSSSFPPAPTPRSPPPYCSSHGKRSSAEAAGGVGGEG